MATALFTAWYHLEMSVRLTRSENASQPSMALSTPNTDYTAYTQLPQCNNHTKYTGLGVSNLLNAVNLQLLICS